MKITFNGNDIEVKDNVTVADVLNQNGYQTKFVLVELNGEIIDHHSYEETIIPQDSEVEADYLCGGGSV